MPTHILDDIMANVKTVQSLCFSPTDTTRNILSIIETNIGLPQATKIDVTLPHQRDSFNGKVQGDLLLVGSPVYEGSIPWPMMEPLRRIEGEGKYAVSVAVYGNRSPETCVEEMTKLLRKRGFKIPAAASFIAEHSFAGRESGGALEGRINMNWRSRRGSVNRSGGRYPRIHRRSRSRGF